MADEKVADLVFEGGGVKGIGLAGAYAALEQRGFTPRACRGIGRRHHRGIDRRRVQLGRAR